MPNAIDCAKSRKIYRLKMGMLRIGVFVHTNFEIIPSIIYIDFWTMYYLKNGAETISFTAFNWQNIGVKSKCHIECEIKVMRSTMFVMFV